MRKTKQQKLNPSPNRHRKHKPYGFHKTDYNYEAMKKLGWSLDSEEMSRSSDISSRAKGRREGKEEIEKQLEEIQDEDAEYREL